jgi:hypothetical protein
VLELILDDLVLFNAGRLRDDVTVIVVCRQGGAQSVPTGAIRSEPHADAAGGSPQGGRGDLDLLPGPER